MGVAEKMPNMLRELFRYNFLSDNIEVRIGKRHLYTQNLNEELR